MSRATTEHYYLDVYGFFFVHSFASFFHFFINFMYKILCLNIADSAFNLQFVVF